ncbi:hypothetical protein Tco_0367473 [Tanacetum coccineum]
MQEVILFYNGLDIPTRQILDSRGAIPSKTASDVKTTIQEMVAYSQKWHNGTSRGRSTKTSNGLAAIQAQLNNLGREIKKGSYGPQFSEAYSEASHINNSIPIKEKDPGNMPEDIKVPLILGRPFLSTARAKIDVYKRKITLRVEEERMVFTSVKPASRLIKRVYMLSLRERMELDLEARVMGDTLVLNRSLDPFFEDYIDLNDLNKPFKLRRNQGDDLMPEGEVIEEFRTRDDELDIRIDDYPSYCDYNKKIHIDCAHNLKFSCMIGCEFTHANFFLLLYVNVMSKKFHNSIMKDKMVYKRNNVVGVLMNVPIFVGTFSVVTDFAVLENMDAYRDEGMGDVIFGEPFLREVGIKTRRFEGMITIYNGNDEVTYQMVRSHPRFKCHTNEQCNKIPPILKVSEEDEMNGISHAYQKLKRIAIIMEYLVNISKRRAFWSLNKDILKINNSDYQYAVSIKEDTAYMCLHSPKTTKETSSIRRIQRRPIRRIKDLVCEDSGRYQAWSLLQETPNTPFRRRCNYHIPTESDSLPHANAQATKSYYKHQGLRIKKAQDQTKTKTFATLIFKIFLKRYQDYQDKYCEGRLLASFQDDAEDEHVGQDTRSSYTLSWKSCQGSSSKLNLTDHRYKHRCCDFIPAKSDSLPHAHTQALKVNHSTSRLQLLNKNVIGRKA